MMKNLLALAAAGLIAFVVVGWFLGWYHVEKTGNELKVDFNTPKITEDINKGKTKLEGILTKQPSTTNPAQTPSPTPPPITPPRVTIVPVTTTPSTTPDNTFVLPGNPDNQGPQILPPPLPSSTPPPLPPR
jgi:hypothetical protein